MDENGVLPLRWLSISGLSRFGLLAGISRWLVGANVGWLPEPAAAAFDGETPAIDAVSLKFVFESDVVMVGWLVSAATVAAATVFVFHFDDHGKFWETKK